MAGLARLCFDSRQRRSSASCALAPAASLRPNFSQSRFILHSLALVGIVARMPLRILFRTVDRSGLAEACLASLTDRKSPQWAVPAMVRQTLRLSCPCDIAQPSCPGPVALGCGI